MTTAPEALAWFLGRQVQLLAAEGFDVHTITSPGLQQLGGQTCLESTHHELPMRRTIHPVRDLLSLFQLWRVLRQIRPEIIQTHTPKAGLLGMIAGYVARVPIRIYTVNGLRIQVESPLRALILRITEGLACALSTEVLCVSRSVRRFVIANGFCASRKCRVFGDGGSHGVDTQRFNPQLYGAADRANVRARFGIPEDAFVLGYIGRIVPPKGMNELAAAWSRLRDKFPKLRLLLCGYCESEHPIDPALLTSLQNDSRVHFAGDRVTDMPPVYAAIDIAVLPTYCEGLPNVVLEAGAMQVPIVATRVPGCVDAVRQGVTGLLVEPRDPEALAEAVQYLVENPGHRDRMGNAARDFVSRRFSEPRVLHLLLERYREIQDLLRTRDSKTGSCVTPRASGEAAPFGD